MSALASPAFRLSPELVARLAAARRVAVLTGAGVSAESGVPTFRDPDGVWARMRPEELASVDGFLANPELVQAWYAHRRQTVGRVQPNAGHDALARLEAAVEARGGAFLVATQNVDGLHQRAGSQNVVELHGSLARQFCIACGADADGDTDGTCDACGGRVRPGVVWFGEALPPEAWDAAEMAAAQADVFLTIGTSAVVYPAAGLPLVAKRAGAYVAEINPVPSDIAGALDEVVVGPSGAVLPALVDAVEALWAAGEAGSEAGR